MWSFGAAAAPPKLRAWEAQEGASSTDMQRPGSSAGGGGMAYMVPFQSQGSQGQGGLPGGAATPQAAGMRLDSRQDSFGYKRATPLLSLTQKRQSEVLSQQQLMHQQQQQQEQQMQMLSNTRRISLGAPQPQPYWQLQQQLQQEQQQQQYQPHPLPLAPQQQQQVQQQQQQQQMGYGQQRGIAQQQQPFARQQQMQQQQQMMMQQQQLLLQQQQQLHYQQQLQQHQQSVQQRQSLLQPVTMRTSLGGQSQGPPGRRTSVSMSAPQVRVSDSGSLQQQQAMADNRLLVHNSTSLTATPRVSSMTSAQGAAALSQKVQSGLSIGAVQAKLRESSGQPLRPTPLSGEPLPAPPVAGLSTSRRPAVEPQRPWTANLAPQPQPTQPQPASRTGAVAQRNGPAMPRPAAAPTETSQAEPHYDLDSEFEADYAVQRRMSETYNRAIEAPTQARAVRQPTLVAEEEEGGQEELEKPFVPGESLLRWLADNVAQMRSKGRLLY